ncbi:MAG: hypothetical protein ACI8RZ_001031 [Myxococcota bacterium]|jgi:hypothetical protein
MLLLGLLLPIAEASGILWSRQRTCELATLVVVAETMGHGTTQDAENGPLTRVDLHVLRTVHGPAELTDFSISVPGTITDGAVVSSAGGAPRFDTGSRHLLYFATAEGRTPLMIYGTWRAVEVETSALASEALLAARHQQGCRETYASGAPALRLGPPE